jgi:hypothetical protein
VCVLSVPSSRTEVMLCNVCVYKMAVFMTDTHGNFDVRTHISVECTHLLELYRFIYRGWCTRAYKSRRPVRCSPVHCELLAHEFTMCAHACTHTRPICIPFDKYSSCPIDFTSTTCCLHSRVRVKVCAHIRVVYYFRTGRAYVYTRWPSI